jgi:hypothetical protein
MSPNLNPVFLMWASIQRENERNHAEAHWDSASSCDISGCGAHRCFHMLYSGVRFSLSNVLPFIY